MAIPAASGYPQYSGNIISPKFGLDLIENFYCTTVHGEISSTEFVGDLVKCGDQITFWREPEVRVRLIEKNQTIQHDTLDSEPVTLVVDQAFDFSIKMNKIDEYQLCNWPKWKESLFRRASYRMSQVVDSRLMTQMYFEADPKNRGANAGVISGNINLGVTGAPIVVDNTNVIQIMTRLRQVLEEQCAPDESPFIVVPPAMLSVMLNSDLRAAYLTGLDWSSIVNGRIPNQVMGFNVISSVNVPRVFDVAVNTEAYQIIAGIKSATAFAAQIEQVRDIEDKDDWATFYQGLGVYGFKVIQPKGIAALYARFN